MKKTISINLGGYSFVIDEDAYQILDDYLSEIGKRFSEDEKEEILKDVENRMAELLSFKLESRNVVESKDVEEVMAVIGKPEDFGDVQNEDANSESSFTNPTDNSSSFSKGRRRLYRDPENKVIGGVASGLAAYMNIDCALMRIIFIILIFISLGWALLIYLILLIAMPEAKTRAQLLEMRGVEPTLENINSYHNNDGEITPRKNTGRNVLKIILLIIGIPLAFFCALGFIGICIAIFIVCLTHTPGGFGSPLDIALLSSIGIFCLCPVIGIIVLCTRAIRGGERKQKWVGWTLLAIWILSLFGIIGFGIKAEEQNCFVNKIENTVDRYSDWWDDDDYDYDDYYDEGRFDIDNNDIHVSIHRHSRAHDSGTEIQGEIIPTEGDSLVK